jgi:N-acetylmuramoyl-L-alanine amidase
MTVKLRTAVTCLAIMMGSVSNADPNQHRYSELECLAMNIYHESKGEDSTGKLAVAFTTINRVNSELFPDTICDVVWQKSQFSWTKYNPKIDKRSASWSKSAIVAIITLYNLENDITDGALFFHANYINRPSWTNKMKITFKHGGHTFYAL